VQGEGQRHPYSSRRPGTRPRSSMWYGPRLPP
jgi:hypothetical protein